MTVRKWFKELLKRSNAEVSAPVVLALCICGPIVAISCAALIYDIFWLGRGLKDTSVHLLGILITAGSGGLAASQFSKRTIPEMTGLPAGAVSLPDSGKRPVKAGDGQGD